jgi:protein-glutamine gamma-glutamyltransferase
MIQIPGSLIDAGTMLSQYPPSSIERTIVETLSSSDKIYYYESLNELQFELTLRKSIVAASRDLNKSYFSFRVFRSSICNPEFWERTDEGGFLLKSGVKPYNAIRDIYINSSQYGTECATAIVIVYYKALADILPEKIFNGLFSRIYLMDWQQLDKNLGVTYYYNPTDYFPGDCRYFKNPDVDPLTPEWQGENAIYLDNGLYYGHGIGIKTADEIIMALNSHRKSSSEVPAYLLNSVTRLDFKSLANYTRMFYIGHIPCYPISSRLSAFNQYFIV